MNLLLFADESAPNIHVIKEETYMIPAMIIPNPQYASISRKCFMFCAPMQLFIHGQWWSIFTLYSVRSQITYNANSTHSSVVNSWGFGTFT